MRYILTIYLALFVISISSIRAQDIEQAGVKVQAIVEDAAGNPIQAKIISSDTGREIETNSEGQFEVTANPGVSLVIEANGYESRIISLEELESKVILKSTDLYFGNDDDVNVAFGTLRKAELLGDITSVKPSEFVEYDNTQYVPDAIIGRVAGLINSNNIRGLGSAMVVLDGIPRYAKISDINLNMEEVEQITVLKDAGAVALYGTQARNGVIVITTKRGKAYKKDISVSAQYGIADPKSLPEYLGSGEYMELYNEALQNDGLDPKFDSETIENYKNGNPYRYPSVDYYSPDYLKSFKTFSKVMTEFSGGNDKTTFYANLGWGREGNLLNFGEAKNAGKNRFNARANVDLKVTDFIKSNVDIAGIFDFNNGARGSYWNDASSLKPYLFTPLLPFDLIDPDNESLQATLEARKNDVDGAYLLGGTQQNQSTPFADIYVGGKNQLVRRTMQFNNGIDVDLGMITKGLSLKTNISFDFYNSYNQYISNSYAVYEPTWAENSDSIVGLKKYGTDSRPGTQHVGSPDFLRRIGFFGQLDYKRTFSEVHNVGGSLLGFANTIKSNGTPQPQKNTHMGLRLTYNYDYKYFIDFSSAYVSSPQLPEGNRGAFSPTLSLGWLISKEDFLKDHKNVDYLKLKASVGEINTDMSLSGFYYYENVYKYGATYDWADDAWNNRSINSLRGENSNLGYEKRQELNLGLEGVFYNNSLFVDVNYFNTRIANKFTQLTNKYPIYYNDFIPYGNYGIDSYSGLELAINYSKKIGDFSFDLGTTAMFWGSKVVEKDELYSEDYLYRKGNPVDSYFGLESLGLFSDQQDIDNHAFQSFGEVSPGDIKYKDQNNDGVIDNNDQVKIGRSQSTLHYGINLKISYKNFSLFALGTGNNGAEDYLTGAYYRPNGDDKYSVIAKQRWTESTKATAKYPRLSTKASTNNSRNSNFWLYSADSFVLRRVQITYDLPKTVCDNLKMSKLSVYVNGSGLANFSAHKEVTELNIGSEPQYRYFTIGLRSKF